jgi:tRNA pseudouridine55 synthase
MMPAQRRGRSRRIDGVIVLNKPAGLTSNAALQRVKRALSARKAGHTGSLDPAATGMLPLCFGEATKASAYLLDADKTYRVVARLGKATDTGDADGQVVATADVPTLEEKEWKGLLDRFLGESMQVPPMYSALRQGGRRLYELARQGEIVEREPRRICVSNIDLLEVAGRRLVFRVRCSKGTYIRTLVEDIAEAAGTVAHTRRLHRESVAGFRQDDMLSLRAVEEKARRRDAALLLPVDAALGHLPRVDVAQEEAKRFTSGQQVACEGPAEKRVRVYGPDDRFLGVGETGNNGLVVPKRVFLLSRNGLGEEPQIVNTTGVGDTVEL